MYMCTSSLYPVTESSFDEEDVSIKTECVCLLDEEDVGNKKCVIDHKPDDSEGVSTRTGGTIDHDGTKHTVAGKTSSGTSTCTCYIN